MRRLFGVLLPTIHVLYRHFAFDFADIRATIDHRKISDYCPHEYRRGGEVEPSDERQWNKNYNLEALMIV